MVVNPDFSYERSLLPSGVRYLLGIDEVGRGPWAGPVTIGAFLLDLEKFNPDEFIKLGVRDSKKVTNKNRQKIFSYFQQNNFTFQVVSASSSKIDERGIAPTIKGLILYILDHFRGQFDFCLVDGNYQFNNLSLVKGRNPEFNERRGIKSIVKADSSCFSVAAASICAKVVRDQKMDQYDQSYPGYGFGQNKGYGTAAHFSSLQKLGICPIHRKSYKPIKSLFSPIDFHLPP
ncbi:MAG: ribonuclease HII [Candidatus Shapirobacteria bacterium]|jgi:ribonuclease HII